MLAAFLLMAEAVGLGLLHLILGLVVERQEMSLAGISSTTMSLSAWVGGGLLVALFLLCGGVLLGTAIRDRPPRRLLRVVVAAGAGCHLVLGALAVGLIGWAAFAAVMVLFGLIVLALMAYPAAGVTVRVTATAQ